MGVIQRVVKPTTHRTKRILKNKQPKIIENTKKTIFLRGWKTHETVSNFCTDICNLKKPHSISLSKKHEILPFEDLGPIEKLCNKYDVSMFVFSSHNKKRPDNLVIGRLFDHHVLDAFEFGVESFKSMLEFKSWTPSVGIKPALVFMGEDFDTVHSLNRMKSLFIDLFHQNETELVHLNNVEYVVTFAVVENKVLIRTYRIVMKNVGEKSPRVELESIGPCADLTIRRQILASDDLFKKACSKPKIKGKKIKNVRRDAFGSKLGRVHMTPQDVNKLQTRKMKGLKKPKKDAKKKKNPE
ncbi:hypothetical protein V9T40_007325 [Parthenolecanium corni]|uniref:Ribosome production factor 2 homolog n=1 Tax=Parthenolecanium corni TaxID=536013 RepID=A0AAN9TV46_9HEMI